MCIYKMPDSQVIMIWACATQICKLIRFSNNNNNNNVYSIIITVYYRGIRGSSLSKVTRLRTLQSGVRIPAGQRNFIFSKMSRPTLGAHPTSDSPCKGILSRGQSGRDVMLTTYLHLQPTSRTCLAILPPSQHAFKERTVTFIFTFCTVQN